MRPTQLTSSTFAGTTHLDAAKDHLRFDSGYADAEIEAMMYTAIARIEGETGRQMLTATYAHRPERFPTYAIFRTSEYHLGFRRTAAPNEQKLYLPFAPLVSVQSVTYYDSDDTQQTWDAANYDVYTHQEPGYILPAFKGQWPDSAHTPEVSYTSGYGTAWADLPHLARHCILILTEHYFYNRSAATEANIKIVPEGVQTLINQLKVGDEFTKYSI